MNIIMVKLRNKERNILIEQSEEDTGYQVLFEKNTF